MTTTLPNQGPSIDPAGEHPPTGDRSGSVAATTGYWGYPTQRQWLVEQRNAGHTPSEITQQLIDTGWDADNAARASLHSLRSSDRQTLTYSVLTLASGFAALGLATSLHLMLAGNPDPYQLTYMLSLCVVMAPIAVVAGFAARRVEARSRFVMWSSSRRGWFGALAICTAVVGVGRLLTYVFHAIASLTGAYDEPLTVASSAQVVVSLAVSIPLFVWSFTQWRRSNVVIGTLAASDARHDDGPAGADGAR